MRAVRAGRLPRISRPRSEAQKTRRRGERTRSLACACGPPGRAASAQDTRSGRLARWRRLSRAGRPLPALNSQCSTAIFSRIAKAKTYVRTSVVGGVSCRLLNEHKTTGTPQHLGGVPAEQLKRGTPAGAGYGYFHGRHVETPHFSCSSATHTTAHISILRLCLHIRVTICIQASCALCRLTWQRAACAPHFHTYRTPKQGSTSAFLSTVGTRSGAGIVPAVDIHGLGSNECHAFF